MMREFMFEEEMHQSLACVPMAVRRKLDRVFVKIGLKQSQALGRGERLAICHLPIDHENERETLKLLIAEAVERACGVRAALSGRSSFLQHRVRGIKSAA